MAESATKDTKKQWDREVRNNARDLYLTGYTVTEVAVELEIPVPTIRYWQNKDNCTDSKRNIELSTNDSDGIKVIKDIVKDSSKIKTPDARFNIKYLGAPRYGIKVYAEDYKTAEKSLKLIVQKIEGKFKSKGKFAFNKE